MAIGVGLALGPPLAGRLIDAHDAHWGYAFALGCGILALAAGLAGRGRLRRTPPSPDGPVPARSVKAKATNGERRDLARRHRQTG
jgi:MFS family permease